jgi:hypothetical protein
MTVNEAIDELKEYADMGYGDKLLYMLQNNQDHIEVKDISPLPDGSAIEAR